MQGLLSEYENPKNNLNFSMINEQNFVTKVSANDFNVDFLATFFSNDSIFFNKLNVSGDAELNISNSNEVNNFYFGLNLTGNLEYFTNFGKKNILFNKDSLKGFSENNNIKITSNFMVDDSELIVGLKKVKNKKPIFI